MICREIVNRRLGHGNKSRDNPFPALISLRVLYLTNSLAISTAQQILGEMYQSYARAGLVTPEVAQQHFNDRDTAIPVDFRDQKTKAFDLKIYERKVRELSNRSTTEFREEQARELLAAKVRDVVRDPVRISETEAWDEYERRYSTATLSYVGVKEAWAARWTVDVGQADALLIQTPAGIG